MTEKDLNFDHKPAVFPSPANGKQSSCQIPIGNHESSAKSSATFASYSQNLPAKGKLILPTAIWVVIILAGICFLSLMGSLTKTMKTLDTLVEIERENRNVAAKERHQSKSSDDLDAILFKEPSVEPSESQASWLRPKSDSWLASSKLFNLDSLVKPDQPSESQSSVLYSDDDGERLVPNEINDAIESMFNQMIKDDLSNHKSGRNNLHNVNHPIRSKIVISSSVVKPAGLSLLDQQQHQQQQPEQEQFDPSSLVDSMMKEVLEESNANELLARNENKPKSSFANDNKPNHQQSSASSGSLITANIDNLNINFNQANDQSDDTKSKGQKPQDQQDNLDESIESLVLKAFNGPTISELDSPGLQQFVFGNKLSKSVPNTPVLSIMPQNPQDSMRLVLKFDDDKSGNSSTSERPKISSSSPYEFSIGQDMIAPKHTSVMDAQLESLSNDLAKILNSASKSDTDLNKPSLDDSDKGSQDDGSFVVLKFGDIDQGNSVGEAIQAPPKKPAQDAGADNKIGDLFKLFFGPPPDSKLVVMPTDKPEETRKPHRHHHSHHKHDHQSKQVPEPATTAPEIVPIVKGDRASSTIQPIAFLPEIVPVVAEAQSSGDKNATKVEGN